MPDAKQGISSSTAILVAGAMIGTGLFFGLRGRETTPALTASVVTTPAPETKGRSPEVVPPAVPSQAGAADEVTKLAAAAIAKHRAVLVEKCWNPSVQTSAAPPKWKATFLYGFDAAGKQLVRGVQEERGGGRPEVTQCVADLLPTLDLGPVAAGHQQVPVDIEFP